MFVRSLTGQSAIEYLMTYGWMLLVVAVVGGAIFSMVGDQTIESTQGFQGSELTVSNFGLTPFGMSMVLESQAADNVQLDKIRVDDGQNSIEIPFDTEVGVRDSRTVNLPHFDSSDSTNSIDVEMVYNISGLENLTTSGTITGQIEIDNNLMGYWTLKQGQSNSTHVFDVSGREQHLVNDRVDVDEYATFDTSGNSLYRDPAPQMMNVEDNGLTVSAWIKPEDFEGSDRKGLIFKREFPDDRGYALFLWDDEALRFSVSEDGEVEEGVRQTGAVQDDGEWVHVAGRWTPGEEVAVFVDGELADTSSTDVESIYQNEERFALGDWTTSGDTRDFEGGMKEVYVYDRDLTNTQINYLSQTEMVE